MCEPYVFFKESSLTEFRETIVHSEGINSETALTKLVAEYARKDTQTQEETLNRQQTLDRELSEETVDIAGDKDPNFVYNAALEKEAGRLEKKKAKYGRTVRAQKAFKEWKKDFVRDNDEDLMLLLTEQLSNMRTDDRIGLKRNCRPQKELPQGLRPLSTQN